MTLFMKILNVFTRFKTDKRNCLDYTVDTLAKNNVDVLSKTISKHVPNGKDRRKLLKKISFFNESMKYFFSTHIGKGKDHLHDVEFCIHETYGPTRHSKCQECLNHFQFLKKVKNI